MKKILTLLIAISLLSVTFVLADKPTSYDGNGKALGLVGDAGFNQYGYNYQARIFSGTGGSWCAAKGYGWDCSGYPIMAPYVNDKLVMKWNAEWDRGNAENWANGPYDAWEDNEWNGMAGGSGEIWHYKIVWVADPSDTEYPIWGQFSVIMSQGTSEGQHIWDTHATPTGYGSYFA